MTAPHDWLAAPIGDVADVVGGSTPSTDDASLWDGDIPWITPRDLSGYEFRHIGSGERNLSIKGLQAIGGRLLPRGAVLLTTRAPIGYVALAGRPLATNQGFRSLVPKDAFVPEYLYYLLKTSTERLRAQASGSTFPELSGSALRNLEFVFPPLEEQGAIAAVLASLDDKIELNQRMNMTLEELARTLFRKRASDEGDTWPREPLAEHLEATRGLSYTGSGLAKDASEGLPLHNLDSIYAGGGYKRQGIKWYAGDYKERHTVVPGDLIVANTDLTQLSRIIAFPGIVPACFGPVGLFSHHLFRVRIRPGSPLTAKVAYLMLVSPSVRLLVAGYANGTTVNMLPADALVRPIVAIPPALVVAGLDATVAPMFARIEANLDESETLRRLRDVLLPKLISGEMRVAPVHEPTPAPALAAPAPVR